MVLRKVLFRLMIAIYCVWLGLSGCGTQSQGIRNPDPTAIIMQSDNRCIDPARTYSIRIDRRFSHDRQQAMIETIPAMEQIGLRLRLVETGMPDVYVRLWRNYNPLSFTMGLYTYPYTYVYIDPARVLTRTQLQRVFAHEVAHRFGLQHVCRVPYEGKEPCSPVGFGEGVMNPFIQMYEPVQFTPLDLQELRRVGLCSSGFVRTR